MTFPNGRSTREVTRKVVYQSDKVGAFMLEMFVGLNAMTEWLGMSLEENEQITSNIFRCVTGEPYPPDT